MHVVSLLYREEFSAYLLLEKTAAVVADDQTPGSSRKTASTFHELHATSGASAAAAGSGSAGHQAAISCLVHADVTGAPDRWYSAGSDGVVQVWNGKVSTTARMPSVMFRGKRGST